MMPITSIYGLIIICKHYFITSFLCYLNKQTNKHGLSYNNKYIKDLRNKACTKNL